jgi:RNA polymerase sigma-70 factor (ECF subfamily)
MEAAAQSDAAAEQTPEAVFLSASADLYRVVFAFTGGQRQVAEDAVAEAFARAIPRWHKIKEPRGWLFRTAFRCAAKDLRRRQLTDDGDPGDRPVEDMTDLIRALRAISPKQRAAIVLHFEMDLPVAEVAERLGVSPSTASVHIHRGRKRLAALLGESEEGSQ